MPPENESSLPSCAVYETCGGCRTLHLDDEQRSARFAKRLHGALVKGLWADGCPEVIPVEPTGEAALRTRIVLRVDGEGDGLRSGLPGRDRRFVPIETCPSTTPLAMRVALATLAAARQWKVPGLAAIAVHGAADGARALVTLVADSTRVYRAQDLAKAAIAVGATSVATNQRLDHHSRLLGRRSVPVTGVFPFVDELDGIRVRVFATTPFEPTHHSGTRILTDLIDMLAPETGETALVVRAGNGSSALALARAGMKVTALEDRAEIAHEAQGSAVDADAAVRFPDVRNDVGLSQASGTRPRVVVLESTHSGTEPIHLATIARLIAPPRVVVIARSFDALGRDLEGLGGLGYTVRDVRAHVADPCGGEVTTVALLGR